MLYLVYRSTFPFPMPFYRLALLALLILPFHSRAQVQPGNALGLEVPAPTAPTQGHFLAGAYVSGNYSPVLAAGGVGYGVQPYLRYVLGSSSKRARPFVQYSLSPYWVQAYGSAAPLSPGAEGQVANPAFAPLALRGAPGYGNGYGYGSYGGLGSFSVGLPVRLGSGSMMVHVGGSVLSGLVR
jgi:hypothetical protein